MGANFGTQCPSLRCLIFRDGLVMAALSRTLEVFLSEELVRIIKTSEFLYVPPSEDNALKDGWDNYFAGPHAHGEGVKDSVPAALLKMMGLFGNRVRLFQTQRAPADVMTALSAFLE